MKHILKKDIFIHFVLYCLYHESATVNRLIFKITPLNGKNITKTEIVLHGLPRNKVPLCRVHVQSYMETPTEMKVKIWEKGFGEFYPSTGQYWEETIEL